MSGAVRCDANKRASSARACPTRRRRDPGARVPLVGHHVGLVHQSTGICALQPNGSVDQCLHAYEEAIYVLEGELEIITMSQQQSSVAYRLLKDDYALVPNMVLHAYRNRGSTVARWFEANSPQPKPFGERGPVSQDTFFFGEVFQCLIGLLG
jgi:uncharacterized cupin superfamily protein